MITLEVGHIYGHQFNWHYQQKFFLPKMALEQQQKSEYENGIPTRLIHPSRIGAADGDGG